MDKDEVSTIMDWEEEKEENNWEVATPAYTYTGKELQQLYKPHLEAIPNYFEGGITARKCNICERVIPKNKSIHSCRMTIFPPEKRKRLPIRNGPGYYHPEMNPQYLYNEPWWLHPGYNSARVLPCLPAALPKPPDLPCSLRRSPAPSGNGQSFPHDG